MTSDPVATSAGRSTLERARAAWTTLPDWVEALARACDATSQAAVAQRVGYSRTAISLLVNGRYDRDLVAIERRVREALMAVDCPVLGEIDPAVCQRHQAAEWSGHNPSRVALYRACRSGCPHSKIAEGGPS